jgi:hypothetical protein
MRQLFLFTIASILFAVRAYPQSRLGDVACVYITTANLDSSVAVYEKLGFPNIASNGFPVPWAQVSDGSLLIMLRKDATPYIGLTYYAADVEKLVEQLEKDNIVFVKKPAKADLLKRYVIKTPDGFNIVLSNNLGGFQQPAGTTLLTMKPADFPIADKFWKKLGFKASAEMKQPYPYTILTDGLMIIGLHETMDFTFPAITYFGLNTEKRIQQLKEKGLHNFSEVMGKNNVSVTTWEGQHFFIFSLGM